jgi:ribonuclease HI
VIWAHVTTDGSCVFPPKAQGESRGSGGWAAIVEHGSDGWVLRGREPLTTSVRMELRAVIQGLRSLPDAIPVRVHSDATMVYGVWERWKHHRMPQPPARGLPDVALWYELAMEFRRFAAVEVLYVGRKDRDLSHQRAHIFAKAEARALSRGQGEVPLPDMPTPLREREWFIERDPLRAQELRLRRNLAERVQASRRASESRRLG